LYRSKPSLQDHEGEEDVGRCCCATASVGYNEIIHSHKPGSGAATACTPARLANKAFEMIDEDEGNRRIAFGGIKEPVGAGTS